MDDLIFGPFIVLGLRIGIQSHFDLECDQSISYLCAVCPVEVINYIRYLFNDLNNNIVSKEIGFKFKN